MLDGNFFSGQHGWKYGSGMCGDVIHKTLWIIGSNGSRYRVQWEENKSRRESERKVLMVSLTIEEFGWCFP
jgi:hypothetical protein